MRKNNLKGFSSIGLQIIIFSIIVSIASFTVITSTTGSAGEPPGKTVVQETKEDFQQVNIQSINEEKYSMEEAILDSDANEVIEEDKFENNLEQHSSIDTVDEYNKTEELKKNKSDTKSANPDLNTKIENSKSEVSFKEETKTEKIGYQTIRENDDSLEKGKEKVSQKGENGIRTISYKVEYLDGKEISRTEISNSITQGPTNEIIKVGTKEVEKSSGKDLPNNYPNEYKSDLEDRMLKLINDHRIDNGLKALEAKKDLKNSARYKSLSMLQLNYFGHKNPNFSDSSLGYLMRSVFAYSHYSGFGENIGYIKSSNLKPDAVDRVFESFKASPGHNANMLRESFKYVGLGVVFSETPGSAFGGPTILFTQHFAQ